MHDATNHSTACILCSQNCGLKITVEDGRFTRIVGDPEHPATKGYICQKAARLEWYQEHADRLKTPLRRRPDGRFEEISWDEAIEGIASKLVALRDSHGGRAFAYYGGGGQGNHLGGVHGSALRAALGTRYVYTALAQEKTGDFWVNGKLFGRQTCHVSEDVERADCVLFIGTNPWQAHGIPEARKTLRALANDPGRMMIVVDPKITETAAMADLHLRVRPGGDALLLSAIAAVLIEEDLVDRAFLEKRTTGFSEVAAALSSVPIASYAEQAGVAEADVRKTARALASAKAACVRVDLGIQQSLHSTLNSYLEKLLFLLTGNFAKRGGNNLHTFLIPLIGHSDEGDESWRTVVTGIAEIGKMFPPNVLPLEIDNAHAERVRAVVVDSANPIMSGADTKAYREAFSKLELLVVIDVAMTETAQLAHFVLPASSQYEKWEATFFNLGFPTNTFQLRAPIVPPLSGTLPEPEIYRRLVVAMGAMPERMPLLALLARLDRKMPGLGLFPAALALTLKLRPELSKLVPLVLHETLGKALPGGARAAAVLWGAAMIYAKRHGEAVRRSGLRGRGRALGEALFARILEGRRGVVLSTHAYEDTWSMVRHADGRVHLAIPEMLDALGALAREPGLPTSPERPYVLIAGERRAYNANTIYRDPRWRKTDADGALRIHPDDAAALGLEDGALAECASENGAIEVRVELSDRCLPGVVTLPHGYGLEHPTGDGTRAASGPALNLLTSARHCEPRTAVPYHKFVPVSLRPL